MLIDADQIRAARALKNWSQSDLADRTGLAAPTIANIETGKTTPSQATLEKIVGAFTVNGIEFTSNGVSKKCGTILILSNSKDFEQFYNLVYQVANEGSAPIVACHVDERIFDSLVDPSFDHYHMNRMEKIRRRIDFKILVKEGDTYLPADRYASYRWLDEKLFGDTPFYVFGDYLAFVITAKEPSILLMKNQAYADLYRMKFAYHWKKAKAPILPKNGRKKTA